MIFVWLFQSSTASNLICWIFFLLSKILHLFDYILYSTSRAIKQKYFAKNAPDGSCEIPTLLESVMQLHIGTRNLINYIKHTWCGNYNSGNCVIFPANKFHKIPWFFVFIWNSYFTVRGKIARRSCAPFSLSIARSHRKRKLKNAVRINSTQLRFWKKIVNIQGRVGTKELVRFRSKFRVHVGTSKIEILRLGYRYAIHRSVCIVARTQDPSGHPLEIQR